MIRVVCFINFTYYRCFNWFKWVILMYDKKNDCAATATRWSKYDDDTFKSKHLFFIVGHLADCFENLGNLPINDLIIVCMSILFLLFTLFIYTGEMYVCVCTIFINKIFVLNNLALYLDVPPSHPTKSK